MAKIKIRKVVKPLDLDDYYGTGESEVIQVWVNPPRYLRDRLNDAVDKIKALTKELAHDDPKEDRVKVIGKTLIMHGETIRDFWSTVWSKHKDESTHWSVEDVEQLQKDCNDHDPGLWSFITTMSIGMMNDYINQSAKKESRR